jgi:hypothetical protein
MLIIVPNRFHLAEYDQSKMDSLLGCLRLKPLLTIDVFSERIFSDASSFGEKIYLLRLVQHFVSNYFIKGQAQKKHKVIMPDSRVKIWGWKKLQKLNETMSVTNLKGFTEVVTKFFYSLIFPLQKIGLFSKLTGDMYYTILSVLIVTFAIILKHSSTLISSEHI